MANPNPQLEVALAQFTAQVRHRIRKRSCEPRSLLTLIGSGNSIDKPPPASSRALSWKHREARPTSPASTISRLVSSPCRPPLSNRAAPRPATT